MIGGKSMHVSVVPRLRKVDLWTEDASDFDKIQGIIESSSEEESLEEKLKKNFQTANEYLQSRGKEIIYLYEQDENSEVATNVDISREVTQTISLKELEDELKNYLVESVQPKQPKEVQQKISTPRKSIPKKVPTYSEVLTNSRGRNTPAKKSLSGTISGKFIANVVNKFEKVVDNKDKIDNDRVSKVTEDIQDRAKKPSDNLSNSVNDIDISSKADCIPKFRDDGDGCSGSGTERPVVNEPTKVDMGFNIPPTCDTSNKIADDTCTKRKRSVSSTSSSNSDEFDSYTYTIDSDEDYETIEDVTSLSGIDLNSNPDDFESLSEISSTEEESEVDYPSEIFHVLESDYEEPQQTSPTDWFAVISKEIQNYVVYSRQFTNGNHSCHVSNTG